MIRQAPHAAASPVSDAAAACVVDALFMKERVGRYAWSNRGGKLGPPEDQPHELNRCWQRLARRVGTRCPLTIP